MARKRRRNPVLSGALVVNPRRRRKKNTRARVKRSKRSGRFVRRHNGLLTRTNRKRSRRRSRRNGLAITNRRRRHNRRARRPAPRVIYRAKRNRKRSRRNGLTITNRRRRYARRNSSMTARAKGMFGRLPLVGGLLSAIVGLVLPAGLGALSVAPTAYAAKMLAPYIPQFPSIAFYPAVGLLLAALVEKFAPIDASMRRNIAVAMASAGGAVGYYKWITGQHHDVAGELGMLEGYGGDWGDWGDWDDAYGYFGEGGSQAVVPFDAAGGAYFGDFGDFGDWGAAAQGRRRAWIRQLLGPQRYAKFKQLPKEQRKAILKQIRMMAHRAVRGGSGGRPPLPSGQSGMMQGAPGAAGAIDDGGEDGDDYGYYGAMIYGS